MASKKNLKKDINLLIDDVVGTCLIRQSMEKKENQEKVNEMIKDILRFRDDMITKLNDQSVNKMDHKDRKKYFGSLYSDLLTKVNGMFDQLNAMTE
ncbi:MAG: hypothetical protein R6U62_04685 [Bacteroidales bacterium]